MADPSVLVLLPFELKNHIVELTREVLSYGVNKELNLTEIEQFRTLLDDAKSELQTFERIFQAIHDLDGPKAQLVQFYLEQCFDRLKVLQKQLAEVESKTQALAGKVSPKTMDPWLAKFRTYLEHLETKLDKLGTAINELLSMEQEPTEEADRQKDRFVVRYMVERNAGNIYLDFDDEDSPESALKRAIFDKESTTVSAVAVGMGGVGKTCALRGVALHNDAKTRFPGGILYTSLGVEAGEREVINSLAMFVREAGGVNKAKDVESSAKLSSSIKCAADWFRSRNCLFLIDDISCQKGLKVTVTEALAILAGHKHSKVAFTTRDNMFESDIPVSFRKRGDMRAQKMLLRSAGMDKAPDDVEEASALQSVLKLADGLPIAINVIGCRAKYLVKTRQLNYNNIWSTVSRYYEQSGRTFHEEKDALVLNVLMASVDMIDNQSSDNNCRQRLAELCILRKRQEVSVEVLQRIWGVSAEEAKSRRDIFERFNLVQVSSSQIGGQVRDCMGLHDLVLDLSRHLASRQVDCMENTSRRVINSYLSNHFGDEYEASSSQAGLLSTSQYGRNAEIFRDALIVTDDDGFVLRNVFRLLHIAKLLDHAIALLSDPRWMVKQFNACGWKQVVEDITETLGLLDEDNLQVDKDDVKTFLEMLRGAISESERYFMKAADGGTFVTQMYGRLYHYRSYTGISTFLARIEEDKKVSWLKSHGAFPAPQPSIAKVLEIDDVRLVQHRDSLIDIVSFDRDKKSFLLSQYCKDEDELKRRVQESELPRSLWRASISDVCHKVACSADGGTFVVGLGSKLVLYDWLTRSSGHGQSESHVVSKLGSLYGAKIWSIAVSADGSMVVCGNKRGRLTSWKKANGVWTATAIGTHRGKVHSVCIVDDGGCIVSCSSDKTAIVWTWDGQKWQGCRLPHTEKVRACSVSKCGSLILTSVWGYGGDGKCLVWTTAGTTWQAEEIQGYWFGMNTAAVSKDKNLIVCGGWRYVAVLRREDHRWKRIALQGHTSFVRSVAISDRCSEVSSASIDGTVRVFDLDSRQWQPSDSGGHTRPVLAVALSPTRVVSGDVSGNVTVWSLHDGDWVKKWFEVGEEVWSASLHHDGRRVRLALRDKGLEYFVERDGEWLPDEDTEAHLVEWPDASVALEKDKWPGFLSPLRDRVHRVFEVPGGQSWAVTTFDEPYFDIVQVMNGR